MTTASPRSTATSGASVLFGAALAALVAGLGVTLVGGLADGAPAAYGALAGTLLVVGVFFFGAGVVHVAAGLVPAASLLVALLTYTLQVLVLALVLAGLNRSGLLDDALDRRWLAAAVIAGTVAWMVAQIGLTARLRLPVYDLPERADADTPGAASAATSPATSAERPERPEAGAR
jgi:ATP synthase protein I